MLYVDTNIILRYLLMDHKDLSAKAVTIIENENIYIKNEVLAEVVYVLNKTYKVERIKLNSILREFIKNKNVFCESKDVLYTSLETFANKNIDFVDSLLYAYSKIKKLNIISFDKKLNKCLNSV